MKPLVNLTDKRVLKEKLAQSKEPRVTVSFYKYATIGNPSIFRDFLFLHWNQMGVLGRTYVANEGINAQISVPASQFEAFKTHLFSISFLDGVRLNTAANK